MKLRWLSVPVLALAAALQWSGPASGASFVPCGDVAKVGAGVYNVKAKGVGCRKARRVANAYWHSPGGTRKILNFACRSRPVGEELSRGYCSRDRGTKVIKFEFGA